MNLATKLTSLRKKNGLTQIELAEILNISRQAVSRWEVGTAVPSIDNLKVLSELYRVSIDYLLNDDAQLSDSPEIQTPETGEGEAEKGGAEMRKKRKRSVVFVCALLLIAICACVLAIGEKRGDAQPAKDGGTESTTMEQASSSTPEESTAAADEDIIYYGSPEIDQIPYSEVEFSEERMVLVDEDMVHYGINELALEDFVRLTSEVLNTKPESCLTWDFPGAEKNKAYSDFAECDVTAESSLTLMITDCVWKPIENDLEIGIYNWTTAENWYVIRTNGQANDCSITFSDLTEGTYSMYVRNRGTNTLPFGYIRYILK